MSYTLFVNPSISNKTLPTSKNPASWTPSLFPPSPPETVCRLRRACEETVVWQWALTSLMSVIPLSTSPVITPEGLKFKECSPPLFLLFGHLSPSFWLQRLSLQLLLVHVHFTAVSASSLSRCWIQGSLYSGVYFLLSECPLYSFLFKVSDDADQPTAYHSIIPLSLSHTHISSPICLRCLVNLPLCLFSLSLSFDFCVFFLQALREMSAPAVFFTIWLGNKRKWEFICFRDRQRGEKSQTSPTPGKKQSIF